MFWENWAGTSSRPARMVHTVQTEMTSTESGLSSRHLSSSVSTSARDESCTSRSSSESVLSPEVHTTGEADGTRAKHELASHALALEQLLLQARYAKEAAEKELTTVRGALQNARRAVDSFRLKLTTERALAAERAALSQTHAVALAHDESKRRGVLELTATSLKDALGKRDREFKQLRESVTKGK